jgi:hypothetical protein
VARAFFGLLQRREVVVPSARGWIVLGLLLAGAAWAALRGAQPFLAVNRPIGGDILVVEGWIPDYALREALYAFRSRPYRLLVTTGGPLPQGMIFSSYGTYADYAAASLKTLGLGADSLATVPAPESGRDRTYMEGIALRAWLQGRDPIRSVDLFSFSAHARRSRMLYRMALGKGMAVGVYSPRDWGYDPKTWWKTSNGFRRVSDEIIAYAYALILFRG